MSEKAYTVNTETKEELESGVLDMIIAFDTTGSMSTYIEDVKKHVRGLIPELLNSNPDLHLGIVAFGDYCDMKSVNEFGDAYQVIKPTRDENSLIAFVQNAKDTGGGDSDEFYELVLHKILNETNWRDDAKKTILLIADAQPHPVGYTYRGYVTNNQIDWHDEMKHASEMGVQIDTLSLCFYGEDWYKELSERTNGVYSRFKTSSKTTEFIKTAAFARGGAATAMAFAATIKDYSDAEISSVATNYMCKNSIASSMVSDEDIKKVTEAYEDIINEDTKSDESSIKTAFTWESFDDTVLLHKIDSAISSDAIVDSSLSIKID